MEQELKKIFRNFQKVEVSTVNLNSDRLTVQVIADGHLMSFETKTSCTEINDDLIIQALRTHERKIQHVHIK